MRLLPSCDGYMQMNELATMIAIAKNPHMVLAVDMDLPEPEQRAIVTVLEDAMQEYIEFCESPLYEFVAA